MKSRNYARIELLAILKNKKLLISLLGVALIPLLYSTVYLWAFWDPYGKLNTLPVAVVNEDKGAVYEGKETNVGKEFVDKLKEKDTFAWHFVTKEEAVKGLQNNKYYLAFEIPEDFSQKAVNMQDDHPTAAQFTFYPNESFNFTSSQMGRSAVEKMKEEISAQLTKTYTEAVFGSLHKLADGLTQASSGAQQLSDGTKSMESGIQQLNENMAKLAAGTLPIQSGTSDLLAGAGQLSSGLAQLQQGAGQLTTDLGQLEDSHKQLSDASKQAEAGTAQLKAGLDSSVQGSEQVKQGSAGVAAGLEQFAAAHPDLAKDPAFAQLLGTAKAVAGGADTLAAGQKQLADGAAKLDAGEKQLNAGLDIFGQKLGEAKQGGQSLAEGTGALVQGGSKLQNGLTQLSGGIAQLSDGSQKLEEGAKTLSDGAGTLSNGSTELSGKLKDASDQTSGIKSSDELYTKVASPVDVQEEKLTAVPNYGTGIAPYFISIGLFVGALMLTIIYPLNKPAGTPKSGLSLFLGKFTVLLLMGTIQTVIVDLVVLQVIGMEVRSVPLFFLFSLITSWTFMALIQMLVTPLGDPGRFIAVIVLVLQLTTSAGTFPLELIPNGLQKVNGWLPMAYSVPGFKAVISSGDYAYMWHNAAIIGAYGIGFALVTLAYFTIAHKRSSRKADLSAGTSATV